MTRALSFGLSAGVSPRESFSAFGEVAREADLLGFDVLWVIDFQLGMKDVYLAMLAAALATRRILIGPGVTNLNTRHPTVTANAMSVLDELSSGRTVLGLGAGGTAVFAANQPQSSAADVAAGAHLLRRLWHGEAVEFNGRSVRLATARHALPIYVSASQPLMLRIAAAVADGVILMGGADPRFCRWQLEQIEAGLKASGRARSEIVVDLVTTVSIDEDEALALSDVRAWATSQAASFHRWKRLPPGVEEFGEDCRRAAEAYTLWDHLSLRAEHNRLISDKLVRRLAIVGTPDEVVARLGELAELGIDRFTFPLLTRGRRRRLKQIAEELIPRLRALEARGHA